MSNPALAIQDSAMSDAIQEIERLFSDPEKLNKIAQTRFELEEKIRVSKVVLTNLTSGTLEETEKGIKKMDTSLEDKTGHLVEVNALYSQINELSSKVVSLIPKEDFEFIQSVDIASMHIQNTKLDLERIRSTTEGIVELAELLNDPENVLLVYDKLKKLKTERDACQQGLELGRLSVNDQIELEMIFSGVEKQGKMLDQLLKQNLERHAQLVLEKKNSILIKCLQVIHREKKSYDSLTQSRKAFLRGEEKEIRNYEAEAVSWLTAGINAKLDELFEFVKGEKGDYLISETLQVGERELIDYLIFVYDNVRFCFPDYYQIFELNCTISHRRIYEIYSSWGACETLKSNEILAMSMWVKTKYERKMSDLGVQTQFLKPSLTDPLTNLYKKFAINLEQEMEVLALRLKEAALQLRTLRRGQPMGQPQAGNNGGGANRAGSREQAATVYLSKHLFTLFKDNINPVRATREKKLVNVALKVCLSVLQTFQQSWVDCFHGDCSDFSDWFIVSLMVDFNTGYSHLEELEKKAKEKLVTEEDFALLNFDVVKKGFTNLLVTSRKLCIQYLFNVLHEEFAAIFTQSWEESRENNIGVIIATISDDYNGIIKPLLQVESLPTFLFNKLALETMERIISTYLTMMVGRQSVFSSQAVKIVALDIAEFSKMCADVLGIIPNAVKRNFTVLSDMCKLISFPKEIIGPGGDYAGLGELVKYFRETYPDMSCEQMCLVFQNREDISKNKKTLKGTLDFIKSVFSTVPDPEKPPKKKWFESIPMPVHHKSSALSSFSASFFT